MLLSSCPDFNSLQFPCTDFSAVFSRLLWDRIRTDLLVLAESRLTYTLGHLFQPVFFFHPSFRSFTILNNEQRIFPPSILRPPLLGFEPADSRLLSLTSPWRPISDERDPNPVVPFTGPVLDPLRHRTGPRAKGFLCYVNLSHGPLVKRNSGKWANT